MVTVSAANVEPAFPTSRTPLHRRGPRGQRGGDTPRPLKLFSWRTRTKKAGPGVRRPGKQEVGAGFIHPPAFPPL